MRKEAKIIVYLIIFFNLFLSCLPIIRGNITFHTDIARDFSLLEEIVRTKKPTLIGPRAGGISGVFHGPLWLYLNLPAFIIGKGNPVTVGWFWVFLSLISLLVVYYVAKRIFNEKIALLSSLLFSVYLISYTSGLFNSFGALIFFPLFFYFFGDYLKTTKSQSLCLNLFFLGLVVQFQVGFGGVILFLTLIYLFIFLLRRKKLGHLIFLFVLLIPLSTFIVFELRHNFFQLNSVINFFKTKQHAGELQFSEWFLSRIRGFFFEGLNLMPNNFFNFPIILLLVFGLFIIKNKKTKSKIYYFLYFYFYLGFWLLMFFYKGIVWHFFYWPFLPVSLIIISSFYSLINKKFFLLLFLFIFIFNFYTRFNFVKNFNYQWQLYRQIAFDIYQDALKEKEFGYYVFSPDLYAYSGRYAMSYLQNQFLEVKSFPYTKKKTTYLIIEPPPDDKPWLNSNWWKKEEVKIAIKPVKVFIYPRKFKVEKYYLNNDQLKIPSNPNLIQSTHFR